jgi:predicted GNAT family acetyltransferase
VHHQRARESPIVSTEDALPATREMRDIRPLTPDLWPDFEDLFGKQGACYGCWCTHFRLPPAIRRNNDRQRNKDFIRARIMAGPPPGLLAFEGDRAVGWMQIGPRRDVPQWNNAGRVSAPLEAGDEADSGVWAISCFFVRSSARGRGLSHEMVAAGASFARGSGARLLEACPITLSKDSRSVGLFVGSTWVFEKAGFRRIAERKPGRPLMRLEL